MADPIEQRARELLAAECGLPVTSASFAGTLQAAVLAKTALRAIAAALRSVEQPIVNLGDSEQQHIADGRDLNCPACGGSGHVDDVRQPSAPEPPSVSDALVRRFLAWRLPGHIKPDGVYPPCDAPYPMTGTNLLDYDAAKSMLEWVLMDMSLQAQLQRVVDEAFHDDDATPSSADAPRERGVSEQMDIVIDLVHASTVDGHTDEQASFMRSIAERVERLEVSAPREAAQEPPAWMADDGTGRVIDAKAKNAGTRASATRTATAVYSIPLYPPPPQRREGSPLRPVTDEESWPREMPAALESFHARLAGEGV